MELHQILSQINQVEKTKFINCIDSISSAAIKNDPEVVKSLSNIDGQLKTASGSEITLLFNAVKTNYRDFLREQLSLAGSQVSLLVNILTRDGNGIARQSWIENLYSKEYDLLTNLSSKLKSEIEASVESNGFDRATRLSIYKDCALKQHTLVKRD